MSARWCGHCRSQQTINWTVDVAFGPGAESARCPGCETVWGVRERRRTPFVRPLVTPQPAEPQPKARPRFRVPVSTAVTSWWR